MYLTRWAKIRKDGVVVRGEYATKVKTEFHDSLHESCDFAESGEARGILHLIDKTTKKPKWRGYMEKRIEERKAKQEARRRLENAAPDMLVALKLVGAIIQARGQGGDGEYHLSQHDIGCILRDTRAAIAKAEEVKP